MFQQVNLASAGIERPLDILAIAAHPDDVEQTCGGTLIRMAEMGYRTGVLDLTAGDMGTRGAQMTGEVLAITAHPDDVEQTCGGTLIRMAEMGYRTGVLDLTAGDMGTRGTPEQRVAESEVAGKHMLLKWRDNLHFPDARLENTITARMTL